MAALLVLLLGAFVTFAVRFVIAAVAAAAVYFFLQYLAVPAFLSSFSPLASVDPSILYFASVAQLQFGLSVIASAYVTRFIIRRFMITL